MKKIILLFLLSFSAFAADWYQPSGNPTPGSSMSSSVLRSEYSLIGSSFSKMPILTGNNKLLIGVNASGTGLQAFSNSDVLSNIGAATSSGVSSAISAAFNAPPALGLVTPNAVYGTTINASTRFAGAGTGLTGTAAALSIGGNAATATNATNATNLTGTIGSSVVGVTQPTSDISTKIATTAFVDNKGQAFVLGLGQNYVSYAIGAGAWSTYRKNSVTYYNTVDGTISGADNKPIMLYLGTSAGTGSGVQINVTINGVSFVIANDANSGGQEITFGSVLVPSGASYLSTVSGGGGATTFSQWVELR